METKRCSNCGKIDNKYKMFSYNTGRVIWLCKECYDSGNKEATKRDVVRNYRMRKDSWRKQ